VKAVRFFAVFVAASLALAVARGAEEKPICTDTGPFGQSLRKWAAEGTAAGNTGDWYDNRDSAHSMLELALFPQLQVVPYSEEDKKAQRHWGLQREVLPRVTLGNSSTSAPPTMGGSNGRQAYCDRASLEALARQYRANNLYVYPEHRDHDPDDAEDGYGDLFPTNTPYVLLSQGSSGSDRAFLSAVAATLAAFQPEVKAQLIKRGLLMPVIQMILRRTYQPVKSPEDYLSGAAHPTVFAGEKVDVQRMIDVAHAMKPDNLPPLAVLRLVESDPARAGRDFFDPAAGEILAETECAIAHIFRAGTATRRLVVSAEDSFDVNKRPLTFHWVVLRGDPAKVLIKPLNKAKSRAEITFVWQDRAPVAPGDPLFSSRVDIGVFVHNGAYFSPPAFVTSFAIPGEGRTYSAGGLLLEIGYGMGVSRFSVKEWPAFLDALAATSPSPGVAIFRAGLPATQIGALRLLASDYKAAAALADKAEERRKAVETAAKDQPAQKKQELEDATKAAREAAAKRDELLTRNVPDGAGTWRDFIPRRIRALAEDPGFFLRQHTSFPSLPPGAEAQRKRLIALGIVRETNAPLFELLPLLDGKAPAAERLSKWQRAQLARFHAEVLASALPGVAHEYRPWLTDFRLALPKAWRDVYRYAGKGEPTGWKRYEESGSTDFTLDGFAVFGRDLLGRPVSASPVLYQIGPPGEKRPVWEWPPMTFKTLPQFVRYEYASDGDFVGRAMQSVTPSATPSLLP
jgi:hypothetical protein